MALIAPFRGLRFNPAKISRMEDVVTPPYDVIDEKAQAELLKKNPYNMIQLDLCKSVRPETLTESRYQGAKDRLDTWLAADILTRDAVATIYIYNTEYTHPSGRRLTRRGFVCLAQLAEFSEGIVKPHEKTFRGVITDRLNLLDTCKTQFSNIFSLYSDKQGAVMQALEAAAGPEPLYSVKDQDGCQHSIIPVTDPEVIANVQKMFADKSLYIADGHHRYSTALQMRELVRERQGDLAENSPFNHIMMYLCPMEDTGLSVLPTHRLLRLPPISADDLAARLAVGFAVEEISAGSRETLMAGVVDRMDERRGEAGMFGVYHPGEDRCFLLTLGEGAIKEAPTAANLDASLQALDVVVLSELIFDHILGMDHAQCEEEGLLSYFSDPDEAMDAAVKEATTPDIAPVLFLLNHTPVAQVKNVADRNLVMPHKSTYFYPKILTGLLLNQMVAGEKI